MKTFFVCLMVTTWVCAADPGDPVTVRAQVWNLFNSVQVEVRNPTDVDIDCRGSIHIHTQRGRFQVEHYSSTIYRRSNSTQTYRLWDFQDRVVYATDFITCRER